MVSPELNGVPGIKNTTRVIVTNPGFSDENDEEKNNEKSIAQGYLVKL
jgi:hypothetical protein